MRTSVTRAWFICMLVAPLGLCSTVFADAGGNLLLNIPTVEAVTDDTSRAAPAISAEDAAEAVAENDAFYDRMRRALRVHKTLAFTTGGLLLAAGGIGTWHFLDLMNEGHRIRDSIGYGDDAPNYCDWIGEVWSRDNSQTLRVIHGATIAAAVITYTSTATIELSMPNLSKNKAPFGSINTHRYLFFLHAFLMAANVGLGFAESKALSASNHNAVIGLGISHMVVGFAAPVIMVASGIVYRLPMQGE